MCYCYVLCVFFCFKQKTAYEMRISDSSSDVCSSDLIRDVIRETGLTAAMFYNHFPDKESLLRELVDARLGQLQERIHASRQHAASIEELFHGAYLGGLLEVRADPTFFAIMFPIGRAPV